MELTYFLTKLAYRVDQCPVLINIGKVINFNKSCIHGERKCNSLAKYLYK